ncbi:MAG: class I SAM-dependent methyltransferase [Candidatus Aminicenantales bacterium]
MAKKDERPDKRFPRFVNDNPFRRLFLPFRRLIRPYVAAGQAAADLGCGPGFYTIALARTVGPGGKVYAVDWDEHAIWILEKKVRKRGLRNVDARIASASDLSFIPDSSVDFVLANGLLCSMAPAKLESTVSEINRILKPEGRAYLSIATGPWSNVDRAAWEKILVGFRVERRGKGFPAFFHRSAVVSAIRRPA